MTNDRSKLAAMIGSATPFAGLDMEGLSYLADEVQSEDEGRETSLDTRLLIARRYIRWRRKRAWMHRRGKMTDHVPFMLRSAFVLPFNRDERSGAAWGRLLREVARDPTLRRSADVVAWWRELSRAQRLLLVRDNVEADRPGDRAFRRGQVRLVVRDAA